MYGFQEQIGFPILSVLIFLPSAGALAMLIFMRGRPQLYKWTAAIVTGLNFVLSLVLIGFFDHLTAQMQFLEHTVWIERLGISYHLGVDGISVLLIMLTTLLSLLVIPASWNYIKQRELAFFASLLFLESGMIGVFAARDLFLFYVFWEVMLIPMYFIIGVWGGPRRIYAAVKFFLFTLAGSLLMLVAIVAIAWLARPNQFAAPVFDMDMLEAAVFSTNVQFWAFLAFFLAFAVKVPMWPLHTWLPDAHVEAPTAGSVILAGVLLKMGGYGMLRICLPFFPDAVSMFVPYILVFSLIAIIYGALLTLVQKDLKKLVAYSSVSHMGFVTAGIFALNVVGIQGAIMVMFSHGLLTGALFLMVGYLYERMHTRQISEMGGLAGPFPVMAAFLLFFVLASLGLPGLSGFVGEFLSLVGVFTYNKAMGAVAAIGIILAAAYLLWMFQRAMFMGLNDEKWYKSPDFNLREIGTLTPLAALAVWAGVYPNTFLDLIGPPVEKIVNDLAPYLADNGDAFSRLLSSLGGF
ncbi:MAG: NADH-quinone oxidoreductase subunit M [Thermoleophilia bacterium]|nr:NADH-quinone oxidoreductase subunit M [Thermoleophilia bacterium]